MVAQDRMPNNKIEAMCRARGRASLVPPKKKQITYVTRDRHTYRGAYPWNLDRIVVARRCGLALPVPSDR